MKKSIYSKDHKYLVEELKKARKQAQLNQKRVARLLGKTQSYVSKVESGQLRIDIVQLKKLAKIYKKEPSDFLRS